MDAENPKTLLDLAIQGLLRHETAAIQALEDIPRDIFVPLFIAAFKGGHKNLLSEMVKVWPFYCLHLGTLTVWEPQHELLKAMIENLPLFPAKNSASRIPKLRILDLRRDIDSRITCPEVSINSPFCYHSCTYSDQSVRKMDRQLRFTGLGSTNHLPRPVELLVDLYLDGSLMEREFSVLLMSKIRESFGALHLCCRGMHVDKLGDCKSTLRFLDLNCVHQLSVDEGSLSDITNILCQMSHLTTLSLLKVTFRSLRGKVFENFLIHLQRMENLHGFSLSSFCLKNHLDRLLRVLPPGLDFLNLPFCELSYRDFRFLSQCPQATHLKLLNLSNNPISWEDCEPFQTLMENVSGTLQYLEMNHCLITDSTIISLIPALSHGSHFCVLSLASKPITMSMLMRLLQNLILLMELKYVVYPIPVHCYERWYFQGILDRQKLADVHTQLKMMLQAAQRTDMM
ncbi:Melanoma antigen preferentially expressed in tumors [Lemmus lemmus]